MTFQGDLELEYGEWERGAQALIPPPSSPPVNQLFVGCPGRKQGSVGASSFQEKAIPGERSLSADNTSSSWENKSFWPQKESGPCIPVIIELLWERKQVTRFLEAKPRFAHRPLRWPCPSSHLVADCPLWADFYTLTVAESLWKESQIHSI